MKHLYCIVFVAVSLTLSAQELPSVFSHRPRIWIDTARISWLRLNISSGECGATYNDFLYRYNNYWITDPELYLEGADSTKWTWTWSSQYAKNQAEYTAFFALVTRDSLARKRCRYLARKVIETVDTARFQMMEWYARETLHRKFSDAGGVLLDWCYSDLPPAVRCDLTRSMYRMNADFMNTFIYSSAGNSYVSSHNAYNCVETMQNALVLYNEDCLTAGQQDTVRQWYIDVYGKWINGFLPAYGYYRDDDGGWNWGAAYAMWSLTDQFKLFDNMLYATGKDFFRDLPWVRNSINQYWYYIQPDNTCIHLGDGITRLTADNVVYRHAALFNDPRSVWMAQHYSQQQYMTYTMPVFNKLFYKDFTAAAIEKPTPPRDWWSDKVGLAVSRSGWEDDAELLWFFNSPSKRASHEHRDNNTFAVFNRKPLIIDAGYYEVYGSRHFMNYYTRTVAHNTVCVFDSTDTYYYGATPVSNDGGQLYSDALMNYDDIFKEKNQRGKWLQFGAGALYSYSIADAALSYDSSKLDRFVRRILYHKPGKIAVLDHLHLRNTVTQQRDVSWLLHTVNKPGIGGALVSEPAPGHIEIFDGRDYVIHNGDGQAAVRTLLPERTTVTRIGGNGYEYWVNGVNYPPIEPIDTLISTPGSWRIEVKPETAQDSLVFLHTITLGETGMPASPGGEAFTNEYTIAVDWANIVYMFSAVGDTGIVYHKAGPREYSGEINIFALDMRKNTPFIVEYGGSRVAGVVSDSNGAVRTTVANRPGRNDIVIRRDPLSVGSLRERRIDIDAYPNPANSEITITADNSAQPSAIIVSNSAGRCMNRMEFNGYSVVDLRGYPPGVYLISLFTQDRTIRSKYFVKY